MYLVYSLLYALGIILTAPYYLWRMRGRILSGADWRERLGFLPAQFGEASLHGPGNVWIHAVSMGETLAVAGLVQALQAEYPERRIFLSCVTRTGREDGEMQRHERVLEVRQFVGAVRADHGPYQLGGGPG